MSSTTRHLLATAASLAVALLLASPVLADELRTRAHDSHPDAAVALDGLSAEVTLVKVALRDCEGRTCTDVRARTAILANKLAGLWGFLDQPDGRRDDVDLAWKEVEREVLWLDAYIPQAGVQDADALMREWVGTRERIDRFKRTLRQLTGESTATAQR